MAPTTLSQAERHASAEQLKQRVQGLFPGIEYLTFESFQSLIHSENDEKPILVDVREVEEHETGTLEKSILAKNLQQYLLSSSSSSTSSPPSQKKKKLICFCTVGVRSGMEAVRLKERGFMVWNYSIMEHLWGGGTLVKPDGVLWDRCIHVYSKNYEQVMPAQYETKGFSGITALFRGLPMLPGVISALSSGGRWKSILQKRDEKNSHDKTTKKTTGH